MYSLSQMLILRGWGRVAHILCFVLILAVMAALMERAVPVARLLAIPLITVSFWILVLEPRWYRIFPLVVILFALLLIGGYVSMT